MSNYTLNVTQVSEILGLSKHRIRQLCRESRLENTRNPQGFFRISQDSVNKYKPQGNQVEFRKMVIYCNSELESRVRELIKSMKLVKKSRFGYTYQSKKK